VVWTSNYLILILCMKLLVTFERWGLCSAPFTAEATAAEEVTGGLRKLRTQELQHLHISLNVARTVTWPITVAARSKAWTVFARLGARLVGSNPTQGMDVCVRLCCVYVVLFLGRGLATSSSLVQGVLPTVYRLRNWIRGLGPEWAGRAIEKKKKVTVIWWRKLTYAGNVAWVG
jgi:hypothetical protein